MLDVLERIKAVRIERDEAEDELASLIDAAVQQGIGWPQIAAQLCVTRQAARQQYLRQHPGRQGHSLSRTRGGVKHKAHRKQELSSPDQP